MRFSTLLIYILGPIVILFVTLYWNKSAINSPYFILKYLNGLMEYRYEMKGFNLKAVEDIEHLKFVYFNKFIFWLVILLLVIYGGF